MTAIRRHQDRCRGTSCCADGGAGVAILVCKQDTWHTAGHQGAVTDPGSATEGHVALQCASIATARTSALSATEQRW